MMIVCWQLCYTAIGLFILTISLCATRSEQQLGQRTGEIALDPASYMDYFAANHVIRSGEKSPPLILLEAEQGLHLTLRTDSSSRDGITSLYREDLQHIVSLIKSSISDGRLQSISDRLAVMIVFAFPLEMPWTEVVTRRFAYLHCSVSLLMKNIAPFTDIDLFIWLPSKYFATFPVHLFNTIPSYGNLFLLPIPESSWQAVGMRYNPKWNYAAQFPEDYFLMGRWRSTFAFDFVREMGYDYMLQMDDDVFLTESIPFNIVQEMRKEEVYLGVRGVLAKEEPELVAGLAEFTRFWMVTRNMTTPFGHLFQHVEPRNISGLHSGANGGWDRSMFSACFHIFQVPFWFQEPIQDFVHLFLSSGADVQQRWLEQGIQNMARLLFYPKDYIYIFNIGIIHGKPQMDCIADLGCGASLKAIGYVRDIDKLIQGSLLTQLFVDRKFMTLYSFVYTCQGTEAIMGPCVDYDDEVNMVNNRITRSMEIFLEHYNLFSMISLEKALDIVVRRWRYQKSLSNATVEELETVFY